MREGEYPFFILLLLANSRPICHCQVASWLLNSITVSSLSSNRCVYIRYLRA